MKPILAIFAVLVILLIANTSQVHGRPSRGEYWHVMNSKATPMTQDLMDMRNSAGSALSNRKCDTKVDEDIVHEKIIVDKSDPIPVTIYHGDSYLKGNNLNIDESDPIPDLSIYHGDSHLKGKHLYIDESDPIPDITIYHGDSHLKGKDSLVDESDPIPDLTIYDDDSRLKGNDLVVDKSDPIPDLTIYHGNSHLKGKK